MVELATWGSGVPDLAPGQIRRPPPPCPVSHSHSHVLRYPHANFQPPSMSLGWIFILGVLAPCSAPLAFFAKHTHRLSFPCPQLPTCKFSASFHVVRLDFYFGPLARPLDFFRQTH